MACAVIFYAVRHQVHHSKNWMSLELKNSIIALNGGSPVERCPPNEHINFSEIFENLLGSIFSHRMCYALTD